VRSGKAEVAEIAVKHVGRVGLLTAPSQSIKPVFSSTTLISLFLSLDSALKMKLTTGTAALALVALANAATFTVR